MFIQTCNHMWRAVEVMPDIAQHTHTGLEGGSEAARGLARVSLQAAPLNCG